MAFDYVASACTVRPTHTAGSETPSEDSVRRRGTGISLESMDNISPYVTDFVKYASNLPRRAYVGVHTLTASFSGALFSGGLHIVANANFRDEAATATENAGDPHAPTRRHRETPVRVHVRYIGHA